PGDQIPAMWVIDPMAPTAPLTVPAFRQRRLATTPAPVNGPDGSAGVASGTVVRTALAVEVRGGRLCVFLPPVHSAEDYIELIAAVEATAAYLKMPVLVEGYPPPFDSRLRVIKVTPDPGVIEINVHPSSSWRELVENTVALY